MRRASAVLVAVASLLSAACVPAKAAPVPAGPRTLDHLTAGERLEYLRKATLWHPTRIAEMDLLAGPAGPGSFTFDQQIVCTYVSPTQPLSGSTPKFDCDLGGGDVVKVKFGRKNGEVYAEVAASRLFWALGFGADRMYPVEVTCRDCPIEPWWWTSDRHVEEKTFEIAAIERRLDGRKIATVEGEGWKWAELDQVDERAGGAPRSHRDALKLLMAMIQNSDTKADNQRLVCLPGGAKKDAAGDEICERPFLYVQDLGVAFGEATTFDHSKNNLQDWEGEAIWKDPGHCVGNLRKSLLGNLQDPPISEAGRKFLADLLVQLSDKQIADMFTAARVERFHTHPERNLPVSEWVRVFKKKREEIVRNRCPS